MKRRLAILALVLPLLDPLSAFARAWAGGTDQCHEHVCQCVRHCPPRQSAHDHCQQGGAAVPQMRGACHHDQAAVVASVTPALASRPPRLGVARRPEPAAPAVGETLPAGFARLDPRPPRAL
jgi:hypothetical protein